MIVKRECKECNREYSLSKFGVSSDDKFHSMEYTDEQEQAILEYSKGNKELIEKVLTTKEKRFFVMGTCLDHQFEKIGAEFDDDKIRFKECVESYDNLYDVWIYTVEKRWHCISVENNYKTAKAKMKHYKANSVPCRIIVRRNAKLINTKTM